LWRSYVGRAVGAHFWDKILMAKYSVLVCGPYLSPKTVEKLIEMAKRDVKVLIITSLPKQPGENPQHEEAIALLEKALQPERDWLGRPKKDWKKPNLDVKYADERFIHAKIYAVDGELAVVGSANLTESGLWENIEYILIFEGDDAMKIESDFEKLWNLYTTEGIKKGEAFTPEAAANLIKGILSKFPFKK